jgi:uncharacterized protein YozE (UPF0346 family)
MSFETWLAAARIADDPEGDFIQDARDDDTVPDTLSSAEELRAYLKSKGACPEALAVVPYVWRRYRRWQVKRGRFTERNPEPPSSPRP